MAPIADSPREPRGLEAGVDPGVEKSRRNGFVSQKVMLIRYARIGSLSGKLLASRVLVLRLCSLGCLRGDIAPVATTT